MPESPLPASSLNPKQLQARGSGLEKATPPTTPRRLYLEKCHSREIAARKTLSSQERVSGDVLGRCQEAGRRELRVARGIWAGGSGDRSAHGASAHGASGVAVAERLGGTGPGATVQEESRPSQEHSAAAARAPGLRGREGWVPGCQGGSVLLALVVGASAGRITRLQGSTRCHPFKGSAGLRRGPCALFWAPFLDAWKGLRGRRGAAPPAIDLCDKDP